ncbi:MAG: hypothetical protein ABI970_25100 [Chloroflexota bacterium]
MAQFDFQPIELAVAQLKLDYASFMFVLFCESGETGTRGIIDLGIGSRARGYTRYTVVVPIPEVAGIDGYYIYFRDMLIKDDRLPSLGSIVVRPKKTISPENLRLLKED